MRDRALDGLVALATLLSVGHHLDHLIRGNHVGWPLTGEVTLFTYSLGVYPLILPRRRKPPAKDQLQLFG